MQKARALRRTGAPIKQIARDLGVSPSTISCWCQDIELSPEQQEQNQLRGEHAMGCMLYWAEGAKSRNTLTFANSDPAMIRMFARFLRECFDLKPEDFRFRVNVYLGNGLELEQVEEQHLAGPAHLRGHPGALRS